MPKRSKSSQQWLRRQDKDPFVQRRKERGVRSRSVFKLEEIQRKKRLIKPGMVVVDLGAAPGGWSQSLSEWVGASGRVIALDCLAMAPVSQVDFIQGDFSEAATLHTLLQQLGVSDDLEQAYHPAVDAVLSDMAPNFTGIADVDQARALYLVELAYQFASQVLRPGGHVIFKVFQGRGVDQFLKQLRGDFAHVSMRKPAASRTESKEMYVVATGFHTPAEKNT